MNNKGTVEVIMIIAIASTIGAGAYFGPPGGGRDVSKAIVEDNGGMFVKGNMNPVTTKLVGVSK